MKFRIPRKLKKQIPKGPYCYTLVKRLKNEYGWRIKLCPFYFRNEFGYGDCKYLINKHNLELNGSEGDRFDICLDDQCKSCNINCDYKK